MACAVDTEDDKELNPSTCTKDDWIYANCESLKFPEAVDVGKWLIFENDEIDEVWDQVKSAVEEGLLWKQAKVSTMKGKDPNGKKSFVICVYTYDWKDEKDVMRIREVLRMIGNMRTIESMTKRIPYKTDTDTLAGVYRHTGHKKIAKYFC